MKTLQEARRLVPYGRHDLSAAFPEMPEDELIDLALDIQKHGLLQPIELYEGKVLEGWNRQLGCSMIGLEPRFVPWDNPDGEETAKAYVLSKNLFRRHLTAGQRIDIVMKMFPELAEKVGNGQGERTDVSTSLPGSEVKSAAAQLAEKAGASESSIRKYVQVQHETPDLIERVRSGDLHLRAADDLRRERDHFQRRGDAVMEKLRRQHKAVNWDTAYVKARLEEVNKFKEVLLLIEEGVRSGEFSPEARPFMIRRLDNLIERINSVKEALS